MSHGPSYQTHGQRAPRDAATCGYILQSSKSSRDSSPFDSRVFPRSAENPTHQVIAPPRGWAIQVVKQDYSTRFRAMASR
ncbi:uncharacterized protein TrAFT101_011857 [Trichoderma asperellum]|uniref:uncharacterized protein n=1 Tax=Trichoderma asperellum TaxID=101201 RepID=UPI00333154A3|nr:hypothetical protein TrAFT101_011857 [Trichoderma asperellum]